MTTIEPKAFRRTLENRQNELGNENRNRDALAIETSPDQLDRIQHASDRDNAMGSLERGSKRLREVRAALRRIDGVHLGPSAARKTSIRDAWPLSRGLHPVSSARRLRIEGRKHLIAGWTHRSSWKPKRPCVDVKDTATLWASCRNAAARLPYPAIASTS